MVKNTFLLWITVVASLAACVPWVDTFSFYKAVGPYAQTYSPCGPPRSNFTYPLADGRGDRLVVGIYKGKSAATNYVVTASATSTTGNAVKLAPKNVSAQINGKTYKADTMDIRPPESHGKRVISGFSATFNFPSQPPQSIIIILGSGTVSVNGRDFPIPALRFDWTVKTRAYLQSINC